MAAANSSVLTPVENELSMEAEEEEVLNLPPLEQSIVTVETKKEDLDESIEDLDTEEQEVTTTVHGNRELVFKDSATNVSYEIQPGSSKRGRDKLIDSLGFTYNRKPVKFPSKTTTWTCSVRNARLRCPATVLQRGKVFLRGMKKHEHLLGQKFPKPEPQSRGSSIIRRRKPRGMKNQRKFNKGNQDYQLIKNGSKSGMDLLRDSLGYTYTFKRSTIDGYKVFWSCSVRNRHLRCQATIIQYGEGHFVEGPHEHQHLPAYNIPADGSQPIPSLKKIREEHEADDSDFEDDESTRDGARDTDGSPSYTTSSGPGGSVYLRTGKSGVVQRKVTLVKEKPRRNHETFLGPMCTINLSKCEDDQCNCGLVHCPFCDPFHFKPSKAGRVQDHLELTHFAHGVQYDDLMIVKCFKECDVEKTFGHYHCVFCSQQIIKRDFYARHMLRHLRSMGIPERLLMLPDSKYPDIINAYGYEIPICNKATCMPTEEKHFHCPVCSKVCRQRSLTVNHLWRCFQKQQGSTEDLSDDDETEMCNHVDEEQINLHFSHVKSIQELPTYRCEEKDCCNQMFHCVLCPEEVFLPSYKQQLLVHYMTHWKTRVVYKNYGLLRCFQTCQGLPKTPNKSKFHYHCPVCTKTIQTKVTFEEHLKSCHMLRFGENLIESTMPPASIEDTILEDADPVPIQKNIDFLEDQLIAQSKAYSKRKSLEQKLIKREKRGVPPYQQLMYKKSPGNQDSMKKVGRSERVTGGATKTEEEFVDLSTPIGEEEIFEHVTAVLSMRCMQMVKTRKDLQSLLGTVAGKTDTSLSLNDDGQYQLKGTVGNLNKAQALITKSINQGTDSDAESLVDKRSMRKTFHSKGTRGRLVGKADIVKKTSKALSKRALSVALRRGRGRPKKLVKPATDTFPYSEIKEIIKATKSKDNTHVSPKKNNDGIKSVTRGRGRPPKNEPKESPSVPTKTPDTVKRGRGRPPKASPANHHGKDPDEKPEAETRDMSESQEKMKSQVKSKPEKKESKEKDPPTPVDVVTPKRYGTRGLRKDYAVMNSGSGKSDIKQEPVENSPRPKNVRVNSSTPSKKRKNENVVSTPSNKRKKDSDLKQVEPKQESQIEESENFNAANEEIVDSQDEIKETDDELKEEENVILKENVSTKELKNVHETHEVEEIKETQSVSKSPKKTKTPNEMMNISIDTSAKEKSGSSIEIKELTPSEGIKVFVPLTTVTKTSNDKKGEGNVENANNIQPPTETGRTLEFNCSYCDKSFAYKSNLDDHENKHTGATPYVCEICTKAFPSQSLLMKHKTIVHASVRPYKCTVCHKSFRFMNVLQSHMGTHMKPRSHLCKLCNKTYSTLSTLKFHMGRCPARARMAVSMPPLNTGFTVLNDKDGIVIYTDPSQADAAGNINEITNKRLIEEVVTEPVDNNEMEVVMNEPAFTTETNVAMATEEVENTGDVELYACSECNSAFNTYEKAEAHILTAHAVVN